MLRVRYDVKLIALLGWILDRYGILVITDGYRSGDNGVHGTDPCRGIDLRDDPYPDPKAGENDINRHWIYDENRPEKKCAWWHGKTKKQLHIHLQVCEQTRYVNADRD